MALPRPALLALLGLLLFVAAFMVTRAGQDEEVPPPAPAPNPSAATEGSKPASKPARKAPGRGARKEGQAPARKAGVQNTAGLPPALARALERKRVSVLFFLHRSGQDDRATQQSVRSLRGAYGRRVAVFTDSIKNLSKYRAVVAELGLSQTPSIVIVDRDRRAEVLEGFVDAGSLRQRVADALR
jgi:hypothetical protein